MKNLVVVLLIGLSLLSCNSGLLEDMLRESNNPIITEPRINSFESPGEIKASWDRDDCADEYLLFRALDGDRIFSQIYRGTDLFYRDTMIQQEQRYLYILYKIRGSKSFGPSRSVLGVGSSVQEDPYENNDTLDRATVFTHNLVANCYGYNSINKEHTLMDRDYYSVTVNPHMSGLYRIDVAGVTGVENTRLKLQRQYQNPIDVPDNVDLTFTNSTDQRKTFYFSIFPDELDVCSDLAGGGSVIGYTLLYTGEVPE